MSTIVSIHNVSKTYADGHQALKNVSLDIRRGEILALLGPNGAGKTTLISAVCGIVNASTGSITVDGHDIVSDYRITRGLIGLVPQELTLGAFDTVWNTLTFSRGLFGKKPNPELIESILKDLALWDKKDHELQALSGGMKRRVLIGKALVHEPRVLFLDEPTAGVDVELRQDMWRLVKRLQASGVTIILTTHYIEEAEEIADRVGVINQGSLLLLDDKKSLMKKMGSKQLVIELTEPISAVPSPLSHWPLDLSTEGRLLTYHYNTNDPATDIAGLLQELRAAGLILKDVNTSQSSLEDIFIKLVNNKK